MTIGWRAKPGRDELLNLWLVAHDGQRAQTYIPEEPEKQSSES
jgi:hypothetical protein